MVVIARPGKYRRALVLEFHSVSFSPLFFELRNNATPSRNVTRSYRPLPLFPSFFRLAFGRPLSPFSLPSLLPLPLFAISRATVLHLASLSLPASIRAARKCNKRCRVFTRTVKWYSVSYCRGTSILVFAA